MTKTISAHSISSFDSGFSASLLVPADLDLRSACEDLFGRRAAKLVLTADEQDVFHVSISLEVSEARDSTIPRTSEPRGQSTEYARLAAGEVD
ncbi:hypothetical protein J3P71_15765 [Rhizobium leguminosarum]|nr:hypothetical protein J3P71_15765 [Rhizobium leguminosarum]